MPFISVVKTDAGYFIPVSKNHQLVGWTSEYDALKYYESSYNRSHLRGYEESMSACLNNIMMQPSIIQCSEPEIKERLVGAEPKDGYRMTRVSCDAGSMLGLKCNSENVEKEWEAGRKPSLISI